MLGVTVGTFKSADGVLPRGAVVTKVNDGSNAQRGGIQTGDIIVEINGTVIAGASELGSCIQSCEENVELRVRVYRVPGMDQAITDDYIDLSKVDVDQGEYLDLTVVLRK